MVDIKTALDEFKSVARTFQSVITLAEAVEGIASLEQAEGEARVRLDGLRQEIADMQAQRDALEIEGETLIEKAKEEAAAIKASAQAQADGIVSQADAKAQELYNAACDGVRVAQERSDAMASSLETERTAVEAAKVELADLEAKIQRARAKMQELLGA